MFTENSTDDYFLNVANTPAHLKIFFFNKPSRFKACVHFL